MNNIKSYKKWQSHVANTSNKWKLVSCCQDRVIIQRTLIMKFYSLCRLMELILSSHRTPQLSLHCFQQDPGLDMVNSHHLSIMWWPQCIYIRNVLRIPCHIAQLAQENSWELWWIVLLTIHGKARITSSMEESPSDSECTKTNILLERLLESVEVLVMVIQQ